MSTKAWRRAVGYLGPEEERWGAILLLALAVGLLAGGAAVALRSAVHLVFQSLETLRGGWWGPVLPAIGAAAGVAIVSLIFREAPGHGVPEVIRAVCRDGGRMRRRSMFSRWLGSLANVSSGGSAGLEGPIVFGGSAVGSFLGSAFRLDERRRTVLLACGAAGGIAAVFNAPMTGMIFAMEIVLAEWSAFSILPVVMSAVAATEVSRLWLGDIQPLPHAPFAMGVHDLVACGALGVLAGLVSVALVRAVGLVHRTAVRLPGAPLAAPALCGLLVGAIGMAYPGAIGEGYGVARAAIRSELGPGLLFCMGLAAAKLVATGLTIGSRAPGGLFAPSLVIGSVVGVGFGRTLAAFLPENLAFAGEGSFGLVGMSGLVAGVMQAPLTGIFLVMEVTAGYDVVLPLMIVSALSLVVVRRFERYSLYTVELAESGDLLRPGTDRRILADVRVSETLDADATPVPDDMTLADFVEVMKTSRRNHFPVLRGETGDFAGILELARVRALLLDPALARVTLVGTVMDPDVPRIPLDASLADAMDVFETAGAWVLPVVDGKRFAGLLSKSSLFDHYRRELVAQRQSI
jgi:CIC family chloride channel protein